MDVIRLNKWTGKPLVTYVDRGAWTQSGKYCHTYWHIGADWAKCYPGNAHASIFAGGKKCKEA